MYSLLFDIFTLIFVTAAVHNAANVASGKRKCSCVDQVGCSSKKVALELFPTHPTQKQLGQVSQSSGLNHHTNGGHNQIFSTNNFQPFTSLLNSGRCTNHDDASLLSGVQLRSEAQEDPFEKLLQSQVCVHIFIYLHYTS